MSACQVFAMVCKLCCSSSVRQSASSSSSKKSSKSWQKASFLKRAKGSFESMTSRTNYLQVLAATTILWLCIQFLIISAGSHCQPTTKTAINITRLLCFQLLAIKMLNFQLHSNVGVKCCSALTFFPPPFMALVASTKNC